MEYINYFINLFITEIAECVALGILLHVRVLIFVLMNYVTLLKGARCPTTTISSESDLFFIKEVLQKRPQMCFIQKMQNIYDFWMLYKILRNTVIYLIK